MTLSSCAAIIAALPWKRAPDSRTQCAQVAVSQEYVAYSLAGGHTRVQSRSSNCRALLRQHEAPVTDVQARLRHSCCLLPSEGAPCSLPRLKS